MEVKKREDLKMLKEQMEDALKVRTVLLWSAKKSAFLYRGRIIRLRERGGTFVPRQAMLLLYKDGH